MKPWEMNWEQGNTAIEPASATLVKPWEMNWKSAENPEINVNAYNGTSLIGEPGEDAKPYSKMDLFMKKLFTFEVRDATESQKNNPRIQALEKVKNEGFDDVKWGEVGKSAARGFLEVGKGFTASPLKIYGDWAMDNRDTSLMTPREKAEVKRNNFHASLYKRLGESIEKLWDLGLNAEWLKLDEEIFKGSFVENPSMTRVLSLGGSAVPSIGWFGGLAKLTRSKTLASAMLAGAEADDIYFGAREAGASQNKALGLFAAGTAVTAAFDKYGFERMFSQKVTTPLAERVVNSMLSEGLTEGTQTLWQNMVKKYGYDDSQDLWEAVIESVIGGALSGGAVSTANAGYVRLQDVRGHLKEKGMTDNGLDQVQEALVREMGFHREGLEPLFQTRIEQSLNKLDDVVKQREGTPEAQKALQTKADLEQVYTDVSERLKKAGIRENVANADAKVWQGIALWGSQELGISPLEYINQRMPKIESMTYNQFQNKERTLEEQLGDYIPFQAMYKSPLSDMASFYDDVLTHPEKKKRYFSHMTPEGITVDVLSDTIAHDQKHNMTANNWQEVLDNIDNVEAFVVSDKPRFDGQPVLMKISTPSGKYGVVFERLRNGRNIITTAFKGTDKGIDSWMKKETGKNQFLNTNAADALPSQPVTLEVEKASTVAFASQQSEISDNPISNNANRSFKDIIAALDENVNKPLFQLSAEAYNKQGKADVNSEAFKRWFGDSKVVDENGQPLVVYHGTLSNFDAFSKKMIGSRFTADERGFFFIDNEKMAKDYSTSEFDSSKKGYVMPVYISSKNPLIINAEYARKNGLGSSVFEREDSISFWDNYQDFILEQVDEGKNDGVIIDDGFSKTVVVFEPNQIKSVYNRGTFDPNNDNIYYQGQIADNGRGVELTINSQEEMQGLSDEDFKNKMLDTLKSFKGNKIFNQSLNGDIEIRTSSIKKYKSFFADKNKRLIVPYIPELLGKARFVVIEQPYNKRETSIKAYYKADLPINIDEDNYNVHLTVREDQYGNFFWDAQVKENLQKTTPATNPGGLEVNTQHATPATNPGDTGLTSELSEDTLSITPAKANVNKTLHQDNAAPKGAYMQNLDRNGVIYLFERANASTFMHETAHFFRKELEGFDTARSRDILKKMDEWENTEFDKRYKVVSEGNVVLSNAGERLAGRYVVTDKIGNIIYDRGFASEQAAREYARNEIFARGFEQYLREGKAPNNYLKQAFRSFWNWLRHLYTTAEELNVELSDSIRTVYGNIIGGKDLDFYLTAPVDEVLQQHWEENKERQKVYDEQIALAQAQPIKRGFFRNVARERTDGAKGRNEWWNKAFVPISTRAKRVNIKFRNRLRQYDYVSYNKLNQYYAQIKPFLDKWATMTETDAIAFDLALKNSYVEKQLEIVNKYDAYDEFVAVKNLLNSLFDQAVSVGIDMGYSSDYFPRQIDDVEGFMSAMYGSPYASQLRRALKEADPDDVMTVEEKAEFFNKYLRGFNRRDLNKPLPGNVKDRTIDIVTAEMNKYYKPSMQALISYIEGMNTSIESRKFWGFKSDDIDKSIGALTADWVDTGLIKPEQDAEVQAILKARFKAKGVTNKWLNLQKNISYIYMMGGINSAITQIDDISTSLYKAGLWNTVEAVFSRNRPGLSREELGLERIGQEFVEASSSSKAVNTVFKLTGLDRIDAFGKNTLINATFNKFQKMANNNEAELRARIEPIMEQETDQTIEDIKNGVISENVKLLMFNELADMQPIALSEMPEWYLTSGNGRVFYMLKTFMLKRLDIFRNECFDKIRNGEVKTGMQNLFKLSILMMLFGASKDAIIDMLFGRDFDLTDTMVNSFLGLFGISKYSLYKARDEGFSGFASSFIIPPVFASTSDLLSDIYKSLFSQKGKDVSDYEIWKGLPLIGRFYYWWFGGGRTKLEKKNKNKLK